MYAVRATYKLMATLDNACIVTSYNNAQTWTLHQNNQYDINEPYIQILLKAIHYITVYHTKIMAGVNPMHFWG